MSVLFIWRALLVPYRQTKYYFLPVSSAWDFVVELIPIQVTEEIY